MRFALVCSGFTSVIILHLAAADPGVQLSPQQLAQQKQVDQQINASFNFYGRVVDQDGRPIPNASAHISIMGEVGKESGETKLDLLTDSNGDFSLKDVRAFGLIVSVSKSGYNAVSSERPWPHQNRKFPTSDDPSVYRLAKN